MQTRSENRILHYSSVLLLLIFCIVSETFAIPGNASAQNEDAFAITAIGDQQYGSSDIGVWPSTGQIRIGISNALSSTLANSFDGVGLLNANLSSDDIRLAKNIHDQLCQASEEKPPTDLLVDPMMDYSVGCLRDGKTVDYQGRLGDLPRKLAFLVNDFFKASIKKYTPDGQVIVKFDAIVADVQRQKDSFLVSVAFSNSGHYPVRMRTPDQWSKIGGDRLDVSGFRADGNGEWRADLAGSHVANKGDYPVETITQPTGESGTFVTIPEGGSVTYKFLATPTTKVPKGTYDFGALIFSNISVNGVFGIGGRVNFVSDRTKRAHVTFNTDYPSTPEEWKDYEARQREKMSSQSVNPGSAVTEPGYYRSVSSSGERGPYVVGLISGERTPTLERPFMRWEWVADLTIPARCKPGEPCPREGHWVASTMSMSSSKDVTHPEFERYFLAGQVAPDRRTLGGIVAYHYWQWLGA